MANEMAPETPGRQEPPRQMFGNLIATKPPREGKSATTAMLMSLVFHGAVLAGLVYATMAVGKDVNKVPPEATLINVKEEAPPPPPPPPPPPEVKTAPPPKAVEVPKGFQTLAPPTIVPPDIPPPKAGPVVREEDFSGEGVAGGKANGNPAITKVTAEDVEAAPTFTPYTVKPELKNREEVARTLQRTYPPMLRDAGVGGTVLIWALIDEQGNVMKTQVKETSGHDALDQAAQKVGQVMKFTPALNRDQKVKVWIQLPIVFKAQ